MSNNDEEKIRELLLQNDQLEDEKSELREELRAMTGSRDACRFSYQEIMMKVAKMSDIISAALSSWKRLK